MDYQSIISLIILLLAVIYTIFKFKKNWKQGDTDPKCNNCDIPELMKNKKESEL